MTYLACEQRNIETFFFNSVTKMLKKEYLTVCLCTTTAHLYTWLTCHL